MVGVVSGMGVDAFSIWVVDTNNALGFQTSTSSMMFNTFFWYMFPNLKKTPQHLQFLYGSTWWPLAKYIPWHITTNATKHGIARDKSKGIYFLTTPPEKKTFTNFACWAFNVLIICGPHYPPEILGVKMHPRLWFLFTPSTIEPLVSPSFAPVATKGWLNWTPRCLLRTKNQSTSRKVPQQLDRRCLSPCWLS
jgi:hypothetical protein